MVDRVREGKFQHFQLGENTLHHGANEFIHTVVVTDVQEASTDQICAQVLAFLWTEHYVSMACHMYERVGEQIRTADLHYRNIRIHAVSYTHLRAHETVLDLVCRLLLEKKK